MTVDPRSKTRSYAATAYHAPAIDWPNLRVITGVSVSYKKFIFDETNDKNQELISASGVQSVRDEQVQTVNVWKKFVLASGALQSPKLLELFGIGAADLLQSHGITVRVDNCQWEKICKIISWQSALRWGTESKLMMTSYAKIVEPFKQKCNRIKQAARVLYAQRQSRNFFCIHSYRRLPELRGTEDAQEAGGKASAGSFGLPVSILKTTIQFYSFSSGEPWWRLSHLLHVRRAGELWCQPWANGWHSQTLCASLFHPFSRGNVHVNSADANQRPTINPKYLSQSHPMDVAIYALHLKYIDSCRDLTAGVSLEEGRQAQLCSSSLQKHSWRGKLPQSKRDYKLPPYRYMCNDAERTEMG